MIRYKIIIILCLVYLSCNEPNKVGETEKVTTNEKVVIPTIPKNKTIKIAVTLLDEAQVDVYGGVALIDATSQQSIAFVNLKTGKGSIIINGKEQALTSYHNKDGAYFLEGPEVKISTTVAQYEEREADCFYGTIEAVTITYRNTVKKLPNIQVQDCAHLGE